MLDHITIPVMNIVNSEKFYAETLACLGYEKIMAFEIPEAKIVGYGNNGKPDFWIGEPLGDYPDNGEPFKTGFVRGLHMAFLANSVDEIKDWYSKALELGGKDNGAPGPRPQYHAGFYGAFIIDPDGWKIEACLHSHEH